MWRFNGILSVVLGILLWGYGVFSGYLIPFLGGFPLICLGIYLLARHGKKVEEDKGKCLTK